MIWFHLQAQMLRAWADCLDSIAHYPRAKVVVIRRVMG